jgi:hypothetical protein
VKGWKIGAIAFAIGFALGLLGALFILRGLPVQDLKSTALGGLFGIILAAISNGLFPKPKEKKDPEKEGAKRAEEIMASDPGAVVDGLSDATKGRIDAATDAGRDTGRAAAIDYLDSLHKGGSTPGG